MTMLGESIQSFARERASLSRSLETIKSEVTENYADSIFESVTHQCYMESVDDALESDTDIDDFIDNLEDDVIKKKTERCTHERCGNYGAGGVCFGREEKERDSDGVCNGGCQPVDAVG